MPIKHTILYLFILLLVALAGYAQPIERYNSFSYSVNDGLLQSTIGDIAFDKNNFCWISYPNGIQKFDGKNFTLITVQPGLPDDKLVNLFTSGNGNLYLSHSGGISIYHINNNSFTQIYFNDKMLKDAAQFIGELENVLYIYTEMGDIIGINSNSFQLVSKTASGLPSYTNNSKYRPRIGKNIFNGCAAFMAENKVVLWDLKKQVALYKNELPAENSGYFLDLIAKDEMLYASVWDNYNLKTYSFSSNSSSIFLKKTNIATASWRSVFCKWNDNIILSCNNKLYKMSRNGKAIVSEIVNYQNQSIAGINSTITQIKQDNYGNLYIVTVMDGIKKIVKNNYPIKYYGTVNKENNFVVSLLPDKMNNKILAGTLNIGLLVFDTMQRILKAIKTLPGQTKSFCVTTIIKNNKGDYLLFILGEKSIWKLAGDLKTFLPIKINAGNKDALSDINYFGNILYENNREAVTQSQNNIFKINFETNKITAQTVTDGYTMSGIAYKDIIVTHANDELYFIKKSNLKEIKKLPFKNTGYVRCFAKAENPVSLNDTNNIYIGSNKGIFKIDSTGKILQHLTKLNGLPDDCIYAMAFDNSGFLWCSTNKGIFKINKDSSILRLTKEDGLQENEFNTNAVAKTKDGEIFFAGVNGISSFYPAAINNFTDKLNLLFTHIKINNKEVFTDTADWNIRNINLPYYQNLLSFDFIAMGNNNPGQYIYQYKMEGIDEQWLQNNDLQTVRYFLPPGKYVFKIFASRFFDKDATAMREISITIHAPFYKRWWFFAGITLLLMCIMLYAITRYNQNKYHHKLSLLENERTIQLERERLSRDLHDSLGAYANAVLYNTELLEKENEFSKRNELMNDLKFASKDIITSLRETVWALKKDNYTAQECILRIKNFILPLSRYYTAIHFIIETEEAVDKLLFHSKALNVVRIVQEAVTNAIKHAAAKNISINSYIENNKWKITVTDDGKGFDYKNMKEDREGNGLYNLKQRAIDSGIELTINSAESGGTVINITV